VGSLSTELIAGLKVLDEELKNILTLPVEAYNFERVRQELLDKCIQVPITLKL
jgi:hypothetical protein